jgi:hypothetical protein
MALRHGRVTNMSMHGLCSQEAIKANDLVFVFVDARVRISHTVATGFW